jgi:hypothetical protein
MFTWTNELVQKSNEIMTHKDTFYGNAYKGQIFIQ